MKLPLLLCLLLAGCDRAGDGVSSSNGGASRVRSVERGASTEERRQAGRVGDRGDELRDLLAAFEADRPAGGPTGEAFDQSYQRVVEYYAKHDPESGLAWIVSLEQGWMEPAIREFAFQLGKEDTGRALAWYSRIPAGPLQTPYLEGCLMTAIVSGEISADGLEKHRLAREEIWKLAKLGTADEPSGAFMMLLRTEVTIDDESAWDFSRKMSGRNLDAEGYLKLFETEKYMPCPVFLLNQLPEETMRRRVVVAIRGTDPRDPFEPLLAWLEARPPSAADAPLLVEAAELFLSHDSPKDAIRWAERIHDPALREEMLQKIARTEGEQ